MTFISKGIRNGLFWILMWVTIAQEHKFRFSQTPCPNVVNAS